MEEKELKAKDFPWGYALCFNDACSLKDKCMHYQARQLMAEGRYAGQAVYPTAWQDGECRCFCEKKLVKKAWGFSKLYDKIPSRDRAEARHCVRSYFSSGESIMVKISYRPSSRQTSWQSSPSSALSRA